jgi:hypothetical protein
MTTTRTTTGSWHDPHLEPARRAELLLAEMTTAEKCHQLTSRMAWSLVNPDGSDADGSDEVLRNPPPATSLSSSSTSRLSWRPWSAPSSAR